MIIKAQVPPLTAKGEKAGHTPGFFISGKCKACFSTQTGIKKSYAQHKAFSSLKQPPLGGTPRTARQSHNI